MTGTVRLAGTCTAESGALSGSLRWIVVLGDIEHASPGADDDATDAPRRRGRSSLVTTRVSPARQAASASRSPGRSRFVPVRPWST